MNWLRARSLELTTWLGLGSLVIVFYFIRTQANILWHWVVEAGSTLLSIALILVRNDQLVELFAPLVPSSEKPMSSVFLSDFKAKLMVDAEAITKTALADLPPPYNAVGAAAENLLVDRSAANWIAFGEAVFSAIEAAEAKTPPVVAGSGTVSSISGTGA